MPKRQNLYKPEDYKISDDPNEVILGYTDNRRDLISWVPRGTDNMLLAGYGVRQTEWVISAAVAHSRKHARARYGLDFSTLISDFPSGTFTQTTRERSASLSILKTLSVTSAPSLLVITNASNLLAPIYVRPGSEEEEKNLTIAILEELHKVLDNEKVWVIFSTARLHEEEQLPADLLAKFDTVVLSSKVMSRDMAHALAGKDIEQITKQVRDMAATQAVLIEDTTGKIFTNVRVPLKAGID